MENVSVLHILSKLFHHIILQLQIDYFARIIGASGNLHFSTIYDRLDFMGRYGFSTYHYSRMVVQVFFGKLGEVFFAIVGKGQHELFAIA